MSALPISGLLRKCSQHFLKRPDIGRAGTFQ